MEGVSSLHRYRQISQSRCSSRYESHPEYLPSAIFTVELIFGVIYFMPNGTDSSSVDICR